MPTDQAPLRLGLMNDYDIVRAGLEAVLTPVPDRAVLVSSTNGLQEPVPTTAEADVLLFDLFGPTVASGRDLGSIVRATDARVVVYTWRLQPGLVRRALSEGAAGYLSKALGVGELVSALERVAAGEVVVSAPRPSRVPATASRALDVGLSTREAEVVQLITAGLTNQEIADQLFLSINSVKSFVRAAYRKIGVGSRSQAVAWGMEAGLGPGRGQEREARRSA